MAAPQAFCPYRSVHALKRFEQLNLSALQPRSSNEGFGALPGRGGDFRCPGAHTPITGSDPRQVSEFRVSAIQNT
jgi:hypothetical protein